MNTKTKLIPASSLPEITRQLETKTTKEIAAGLNLDICHVKRFIAEHNVSALDIKQEYRKRVVRLNLNSV